MAFVYHVLLAKDSIYTTEDMKETEQSKHQHRLTRHRRIGHQGRMRGSTWQGHSLWVVEEAVPPERCGQ